MNSRLQCLEVWGDLACFTPPDSKVERYSYPIITPSAARNIFRSIYANPYEFEWIVTHIALLSEPRYVSIMTNEVNVISKGKPVSVEEARTQRAGMYLYRPRFRIWAMLRMWEPDIKKQMKYESTFIDRARNRQYRHRPYLGLRELVAYFRYVEPEEWFRFEPVAANIDIGPMVCDPWDLSVRPVVSESGRIDRDATFEVEMPGRFEVFHAIVHNGWLTTPGLAGSNGC